MRMVRWCLPITILLLSNSLFAQRRRTDSAAQAPQQKTVPVVIALKVDGSAYSFNGQAVCEHAQRGSIYDTIAERWSVRHNDNGRNINLTLWHPLADGADMVILSIATRGKRYDVDTVKRPQAAPSGSANVQLARSGGGGTFMVDAVTAAGAKLSGTIRCETFTAAEVVAGN